MAASIASFPVASASRAVPASQALVHRKRRISHEAGRGLEILGHAIDYLADEYIHNGPSFAPTDAQVKAIQILMALNREIYFACPLVPTVADRTRNFFHSVLG